MGYDRTQFNIPDIFPIEWNSPLDDGEKKPRGMKVLIYSTGREANKNRSKEKLSQGIVNVLYLH